MSLQTCKLIVLGDSGVGKTTIIHDFINQEFRADFKTTIGADFSSATCYVGDKQVELQIWDTAGEERFHSVGAAFYRGTDACILVYDLTHRHSFERLEVWRKDLIQKAGIERPEDFPFVVLANKADLEEQRQVGQAEAKAYMENKGCPLFEVSAKSGQNVEEAFQKVAELFVQYSVNDVQTVTVGTINLNRSSPRNNSGCCQ